MHVGLHPTMNDSWMDAVVIIMEKFNIFSLGEGYECILSRTSLPPRSSHATFVSIIWFQNLLPRAIRMFSSSINLCYMYQFSMYLDMLLGNLLNFNTNFTKIVRLINRKEMKLKTRNSRSVSGISYVTEYDRNCSASILYLSYVFTLCIVQ